MDTTQALSPHAAQQCASRNLPATEVAAVVAERLAGRVYESVAVFCGWVEDRGSLIGSNGECVWAIVRRGVVATVMLRRSNQPSTAQALRVAAVIA